MANTCGSLGLTLQCAIVNGRELFRTLRVGCDVARNPGAPDHPRRRVWGWVKSCCCHMIGGININ